ADQLKATLRHCVDEQSLRDFIGAEEDRLIFFTGKQAIKGVKNLTLENRQHSIVDQVADRVYSLRCRIVHAKEDGGAMKMEMIRK
ncbi:MAG TPA: hypothetical protein VFW27_38525, partial [Actinoplanes sp.]|nr:hypothetical protein [Actinoplanes sp.]